LRPLPQPAEPHYAGTGEVKASPSMRRDSPYSSGRWIKTKNPNAPAVKRECEEDWSGRR
jgi:hypothetical protein